MFVSSGAAPQMNGDMMIRAMQAERDRRDDLARRVEGPIHVIANRKSGTNARDAEAIDRAMEVFRTLGAELKHWDHKHEEIGAVVQRSLDAGARTVVAAGGDGTAMAVAGAMLGKDAAFAALPLGTFNYYARGLGLPETVEDAAHSILEGRTKRIAIASVNGRVFLNNASLGIYPRILKEREDIYARWGRRRLLAHWSVVRTFFQFQRPMHLTVTADGATEVVRTPLLFVARSAYQLERFGLAGTEAIHDDKLAALVGLGETRWDLFKLAWRLVTGGIEEGRDYRLIVARELVVQPRRTRAIVAFDGEKARERGPFDFRMEEAPLTIVLPAAQPGPAG